MAARTLTAAVSSLRLQRLRELMATSKFDAYVIPTSDAHNSEYPRARDARREFISGFTGSAGTAVVTAHDARLWTDGRYFLQAETESCVNGWVLMRDRLPSTPSIEEWLAQTLSRGDTVGIDPLTLPIASVRRMQARLQRAGVILSATPHDNLIDTVWSSDRPPSPSDVAFVHPLEYSGKSLADKLTDARTALRSEGASALVVSALDEVAWLFNLRGRDVVNGGACNPVVVAYGFVTETAAYICVDDSKVTPDLGRHLATGGVEVRPYAAITELIKETPGKLWLDSANCNFALQQAALAEPDAALARILDKMSPLQLAKAIKNDAEIAGAESLACLQTAAPPSPAPSPYSSTSLNRHLHRPTSRPPSGCCRSDDVSCVARSRSTSRH
jgi:Xaa-Pro aminopeptidase